MTFPLTPQVVAAAYEYLRSTRPFAQWKLPHADEVEFCVTRHRDREGDHAVYVRTHDHVIRVSAHYVKTTDMLMQVVAHETIHAYQDGVLRTGSRRVHHNAGFKRLASRVCKYHGWDERTFT